ncbi:MAG TPA: tRNA pseudouridine(38-40) synthase TruA [Acholeplasmataceae bacterium]|jgi:tRNA pseudouridine38-40 synthase|nr:tRNA pseudouridine(38-40) synthase TruA [Acholeplasmataceae bacterium]
MRYKCIVSYDGTNFHGFQTQRGLRTVQDEIENVLEIVLKNKIRIHPAGRTDSGVHAYGQVFHFDSNIHITEKSMRKAINSRLPGDIYIKSVEIISDDFHARYSAKSKIYHYLLDLGEYNPLLNNYRYFYKYPLDLNKVIEASKIFIGQHDFASFTKNHKVDNTVRNIFSIDFEIDFPLVTIKFHGDGFLHNMVRIIVAMLLEVGRGKITIDELITIKEAKNRRLAPKLAPPQGLYLIEVKY